MNESDLYYISRAGHSQKVELKMNGMRFPGTDRVVVNHSFHRSEAKVVSRRVAEEPLDIPKRTEEQIREMEEDHEKQIRQEAFASQFIHKFIV